jgi:hypothetical protein
MARTSSTHGPRLDDQSKHEEHALLHAALRQLPDALYDTVGEVWAALERSASEEERS